jgi:hypothetical protein
MRYLTRIALLLAAVPVAAAQADWSGGSDNPTTVPGPSPETAGAYAAHAASVAVSPAATPAATPAPPSVPHAPQLPGAVVDGLHAAQAAARAAAARKK